MLYRYFKPVIDAGFVYIAQPPLYKISRGKKGSVYAYTEDEKRAIVGVDDVPIDDEAEGDEIVAEDENEERWLQRQANSMFNDTKVSRNEC